MPPHLTEPLRLSRSFNHGYDRVWQEAVRMIAREGFIITATDKASGLISYSVRVDGNTIRSYAAETRYEISPYRRGAAIIQVLVESETADRTKVTVFSRLGGTYVDFWTGQERTTELSSKGALEKEFFTKLATAIGEHKFEFLQPKAGPSVQTERQAYTGTQTEVKTEPEKRVRELKDKHPKEQTAPQQKPKVTKRLATLHHLVKGSSVPSGLTLELELFDTGEGQGPARLLSSNQVLDGEYWAIRAHESFAGKVNATMINPDSLKGFDKDDEKGFATFSGPEGIVMECVYILKSPSGSGPGICLDNKGNQYRLLFSKK